MRWMADFGSLPRWLLPAGKERDVVTDSWWIGLPGTFKMTYGFLIEVASLRLKTRRQPFISVDVQWENALRLRLVSLWFFFFLFFSKNIDSVRYPLRLTAAIQRPPESNRLNWHRIHRSIEPIRGGGGTWDLTIIRPLDGVNVDLPPPYSPSTLSWGRLAKMDASVFRFHDIPIRFWIYLFFKNSIN